MKSSNKSDLLILLQFIWDLQKVSNSSRGRWTDYRMDCLCDVTLRLCCTYWADLHTCWSLTLRPFWPVWIFQQRWCETTSDTNKASYNFVMIHVRFPRTAFHARCTGFVAIYCYNIHLWTQLLPYYNDLCLLLIINHCSCERGGENKQQITIHHVQKLSGKGGEKFVILLNNSI